jgi:hypothetical protein
LKGVSFLTVPEAKPGIKAFCEQKAFPLKIPLQKNFEYLKLSLKFKELNSIGRGAPAG